MGIWQFPVTGKSNLEEVMKDKGKVTVFLCLIMSSMLMLGLCAGIIVKQYFKIGEATITTRIAMSDLKANYNSYIFENYHILLFDKNCYGQGEAYLEERLEYIMKKNASEDISVEGVAITDFDMIYDDEFKYLKGQIEDSLKYRVVSKSFDELCDALAGKTGSYEDSLGIKLDEAQLTSDTEYTQDFGMAEEDTSDSKARDPRAFTSTAGKEGVLLAFLLPPEGMVSDEEVLAEDIPSRLLGVLPQIISIDSDFSDYDRMKTDMKQHTSWGEDLSDKGKVIAYACDVFSCYTDENEDEIKVFDCELEYLISGRKSDYENLEDCCIKLIALRLPENMRCLLGDSVRMSKVKSISMSLSAITAFMTEKAIRYLIAGAWAYVESMAEVRRLLAGHKIEIVKTSSAWITDLENIIDSMESGHESDKGLSYEQYLMLLLAMEQDRIYYRMLDVMDMNARQVNKEFRMVNAAVGIGVDFKLSYHGRDISVHQDARY